MAEWPRDSGITVAGDAQCLLVTDVNQDHCPDLVFGVNDRPWRVFVSESAKAMTVVLSGPAGNTTGVGARVVVVTKRQKELVQESLRRRGVPVPNQCDAVFRYRADGSRNDSRPLARRKDFYGDERI